MYVYYLLSLSLSLINSLRLVHISTVVSNIIKLNTEINSNITQICKHKINQ